MQNVIINSNATKRIAYLDAMRGLVMILVVYSHVKGFTFNTGSMHFFFNDIISNIHVPLFFFLSGYLGYKTIDRFNFDFINKNSFIRFRQLIIPTFFFFPLLSYLGFKDWIYPGGFWFTPALFDMLFVYYWFMYMWTKFSNKHYWIAIIGLSATIVAISFVLNSSSWCKFLAFDYARYYVMFFALGLLARHYSEQFVKIIQNKWVITTLILLTIVIMSFSFHENLIDNNISLYYKLILIPRFCLVGIVFYLFYRTSSYWDASNFISSSMQYVGRHTLDIYMIHYFFIWPICNSIYNLIVNNPNEILLTIIAVIFTLTVVACSLIVGNFIRLSKPMAVWILGKKPNAA